VLESDGQLDMTVLQKKGDYGGAVSPKWIASVIASLAFM